MMQPPGYRYKGIPNYVCCLHRTLYNLKKSPREWYQYICNFLVKIGFLNSLVGSSLFVCHCQIKVIIILVYVNDFVTIGSQTGEINDFIKSVCNELLNSIVASPIS